MCSGKTKYLPLTNVSTKLKNIIPLNIVPLGCIVQKMLMNKPGKNMTRDISAIAWTHEYHPGNSYIILYYI